MSRKAKQVGLDNSQPAEPVPSVPMWDAGRTSEPRSDLPFVQSCFPLMSIARVGPLYTYSLLWAKLSSTISAINFFQ